MEVRRIGFSPVKGARHLAHAHAELTREGVVGDRELCLVDPATDRCLRTVEHPTLLQATARLDGATLHLRLPAGTVCDELRPGSPRTVDYWGRQVEVELVEGPWADAWSEHLGREVLLVRARPGDVVYGAPVTIVTTGALARLSDRLGTTVDPARFRATLVLDGDDPEPGRRVRLGTAEVRVTGPVIRCAVVDLDPASGARDLPVLQALAPDGDPVFGVEAEVTAPGRIGVSA